MKPNFKTVTFLPRTDSEWLALACKFSLGKSRKYYYNSTPELGADITLHRMNQMDGSVKWTIRFNNDYCLGKDGEYYFEPMPSDRSDDFIAMCRFDTHEQAVETWLENEKTPKGGSGWIDVKSI